MQRVKPPDSLCYPLIHQPYPSRNTAIMTNAIKNPWFKATLVSALVIITFYKIF